MEDRKLGKSIFILSATALAVAAGLALYALFLAPAETYAPPTVGAGRAVAEPEPVLCDEADIPPPEGGVPEGYVWRVKPEACFGYPLPDFAFVMPPMRTVLYDGTVVGPPESFANIDTSKAMDGRFQLMRVGLIEDRSIFRSTLDPVNLDELRSESRPDGAVIRYDEVIHYECGQGSVCTYQLAYVDFSDGPVVSVMLSVFPKGFVFPEGYDSRGHDSVLPVLAEDEMVGIVETVARLVRLK